MLLRTRLAIIVGCAVSLVAAGLVMAAVAYERLDADRYAEAVLNGDAALWRSTLANMVARLDRGIPLISQNKDLVAAVRANDRGELAAVLSAVFDEAAAAGFLRRLEVMSAEGELLYSSEASLFPTPVLSPDQVRDMTTGKQTLGGLASDASHNLVVALGIPLFDGNKMVAAAVLAQEVAQGLNSYKVDAGGEAFIVSRRGRMLVGTDAELWKTIGSAARSHQASLETVVVGTRVFAIERLPLGREERRVAADLVVVKDVTEAEGTRQRLVMVSLGTVGTAIGLTILLLGWYMRQSFEPLEVGISVLRDLSRGDTRRTIEGVNRDDEIGRIAWAVEALRREMMALDRLRRSRERQRLRQERFIRTQMVQLAGTLDDEARVEVLRDLAEIEAEATRLGTDQGLGGGGGLGIIAPAMHKMSGRVSEQHSRLRTVIDELKEALAVKTQFISLQKELGIARTIQLAILPKELPGGEDFEVYGAMIPAMEIGGDFYDFFRIDERRLGIVVADVSGKGVPAAFFMAIARTLLKATALFGGPPGQCLAKLNDLLTENNDQELFVTVFYGIYHTDDGRLDYANGGHNPPLWIHDGQVVKLKGTGGMALAVIDGIPYNEDSVTLASGDTLFLYTDGVTEAFDPDNAEFGEARLMATLAQHAGHPAREAPGAVIAAVEAFARGAPQSDDITCVVLRRTS
ncbi:phosphoserine phosphatase RsbU/P [uncultured Gammaproteobacteria bacterium]